MGWRDRMVGWLGGTVATAPEPAPLPAADVARVAEQMPSTALSRDDERMIVEGFRRLTQQTGGTHPIRDLQPLAQDRMLRLTPYLWESNPVAKWIIETTVDFVLGEGFRVESEVPDVTEAIDAFIDDPVNQLHLRMDSWCREFGLYGELCLPAFVNEADGHVRLAYVDPLDIDQVLTDPQNVLITTAVVLKGRGTQKKRVLKVIREETNRASSYFGFMMPALPLERDPILQVAYDGSCFLYQTNKLSNARRGRSDLLADIDWLDGYDAFLFDLMDAGGLLNSFIWDVTLEGMSEAQIKEWLAKNGSVRRAMIRAHNEKVTWKEVTPKTEAVDKDVLARLLRGHIIGSHSFPEHWMGLAGNVNFAAAKEMGLPPVKRLTRRQKEVRFIIESLVRFQLHQKMLRKLLPPEVVVGKVQGDGSSKGIRKATDKAFNTVLPELSPRDQSAILAGSAVLVTALIQATSQGWLRQETAAKVFASLVSQLGADIDPEEEFQPGVAGDMTKLYSAAGSQQMRERLIAQLRRAGDGNGENILQPKQTTPKGGSVST